MDFELPEELQLLQETVRKFVDQELIPGGDGVPGRREAQA